MKWLYNPDLFILCRCSKTPKFPLCHAQINNDPIFKFRSLSVLNAEIILSKCHAAVWSLAIPVVSCLPVLCVLLWILKWTLLFLTHLVRFSISLQVLFQVDENNETL